MVEGGRGARRCWHSTIQWFRVGGFGRGFFLSGEVRYGAGTFGNGIVKA